MQTCGAVIIVVIIFSVLLVGAIIGIACLAALPYKNIVTLTEYTAICETHLFNGDFTTQPRIEITREVFFNGYKWHVDGLTTDGKVSSRTYSLKDDGIATQCLFVGNHNNCYVQSADSWNPFSIPGYASTDLIESNVDCSGLSSPLRNVTKCNTYRYMKDNSLVTVVVESDTKYPVFENVVYQRNHGTVIAKKYYVSFQPGKPTDESGLLSFPDTTVYDFRNGKGDAGDGTSNVYSKDSATGSMMKSFLNMFSGVRSSNNNDDNNDDERSAFMESIRHERNLRNMLKLPEPGLSANGVVASRGISLRSDASIPDSFDARTAWPKCSSVIGHISDQGSCGGCWAMASSAVVSDRLCIHTDGESANVILSPQYLLDCSMSNNGCDGGSIINTWEDIVKIGITTLNCVPFTAHNGVCPERCADGTLINETNKVFPTGIVVPWNKTKEERVKAIQMEIMANGPVDARFIVFSDFQQFFNREKGIYHRSAIARYSGGHAVRIIGWGTESGVDYWLVANSWGTSNPGEGIFRIRRGNNECNIEERVAAGIFA